jgi:hypothetical protein
MRASKVLRFNQPLDEMRRSEPDRLRKTATEFCFSPSQHFLAFESKSI